MSGPAFIGKLHSLGYIEIEGTYDKAVGTPRNSDRCRDEGVSKITVETVKAVYVGKKRVKTMKPLKTHRSDYTYFYESGKR